MTERCDICEKDFEDVRNHSEDVHMRKGKFVCPSCNQGKFTNVSSLKSHMKKQHIGRVAKLQPEVNQIIYNLSEKAFSIEDYRCILEESFDDEEDVNEDVHEIQDSLLSHLLWTLGSIYEEVSDLEFLEISQDLTGDEDVLRRRLLDYTRVLNEVRLKLSRIKRTNSLSLRLFGLAKALLRDTNSSNPVIKTEKIKEELEEEEEEETYDPMENVDVKYEDEEDEEDSESEEEEEEEWNELLDNENQESEVEETECETCEKMFKSKRKFERHSKVCKKKTKKDKLLSTLKCEICGKISTSRPAYYSHKTIHLELQMCHICGKNLKPKSMRLHVRTVHGDVKFVSCDICGKRIKPSCLRKHVANVHGGKRNYSCETCGSGFKELWTLKLHIKAVHDRVRDRKCPYCDKMFLLDVDVNRHVRGVHEGKKDFKCDICAKGFSQKGNLNVHLRTVHGRIKQYKCEICQGTFSTLQSLEIHTKNIHPNT